MENREMEKSPKKCFCSERRSIQTDSEEVCRRRKRDRC